MPVHFPVRNTTFPYPWIPMAGFWEFQALAKEKAPLGILSIDSTMGTERRSD